ncbi:capsular biosynthesis protein [Methylobacterium sp. C25]|uniref:capsular polysaccharide export protein, LipB/KpsS family n=1 Tax=Methylobacterium sp. C25 TaxID=2721622 RepID=UPI001F34A037|nr:capsular biosynthesis protein [Methylobacterium sp. C25]MCE4225425.1 capsular biosynthesis protein [Methylobacterium sp. C25]
MSPPFPSILFPAGRAIRSLRPEIEAATGTILTRRPAGAFVVWQGSRAEALLTDLGRPVLSVAPGPLLSPYDSPAMGYASLRFAFAGRPLGGTEPAPSIANLLRRHRLYGRNRFPNNPSLPTEIVARRPSLVLVDAGLAASPSRLKAFLDRVQVFAPGEDVIAAGPEGVPLVGSGTQRAAVLSGPVDPWLLFEHVSRVYVATSDAACEPRLAGVETILLGPDGPRTLPDETALVALRYGPGVHTFDPWTRRPIAMTDAVERVAWLRERFAGNARRVVYVGISRWKRPALDVFADGPAGPAIHAMAAEDAVTAASREGAEVQAWATRMPAQLSALCEADGIPLSRIEDGFLRSVGLGASLQPGASIVVDDSGIYYDPRTESMLARILRETTFAPELVARARRLRESIVARRLSKYNVGLSQAATDWPTGRRIVLVPGQVEDDASVQYGSPLVRSNLGLLSAARARNPDAFVLYKPHPDVEAGFRPGAIPEAEALTLADRLVGGLAIVDLLDRVDHVETMTSLAGFEALIRGLSVAVHGRPFYAGWGLTEDLALGADRGRRLALDELVAGALILYPRYLDPVAMKPCEPEQLLDRLSAERDATGPSRLAIGGLRHAVMRARYVVLNPIVRRLRARRGVGGTPR